MPCFVLVYRLFRASYFSSLKLHFLQNNAKRSKSMPCVVVKSKSVKGVQTTDRGVHYLTKGCAIWSHFTALFIFTFQHCTHCFWFIIMKFVWLKPTIIVISYIYPIIYIVYQILFYCIKGFPKISFIIFSIFSFFCTTKDSPLWTAFCIITLFNS